jgi:hypothetical protein
MTPAEFYPEPVIDLSDQVISREVGYCVCSPGVVVAATHLCYVVQQAGPCTTLILKAPTDDRMQESNALYDWQAVSDMELVEREIRGQGNARNG